MYIIAKYVQSGYALACVFSLDDDDVKLLPNLPDSLTSVKVFPLGHSFEQILLVLSNEGGYDAVLVSRNHRIQIDSYMIARVSSAVQEVRRLNARWALATPGGTDLNGNHVRAMYSSVEPSIPKFRSMVPVVDSLHDIYLLNAEALRAYIGRMQKTCFRPFSPFEFIALGYLTGRVSVFCAQLSVGINGPYLPTPTIDQYTAVIDACNLRPEALDTLAGKILPDVSVAAVHPRLRTNPLESISLLDKIEEAVTFHRPSIQISIVVRTRFTRDHLLRRLLASVVRALIPGVKVEMVLATDAPPETIEFNLERLSTEFPELELTIAVNRQHSHHSRIGNMIAGIGAASGDFIWMIDDDDFVSIFAFQAVQRRIFLEKDILLFAGSAMHKERWRSEGGRTPVLASSEKVAAFQAAGWRGLFKGSNLVPINGGIFPRAFLKSTVGRFDFSHDLSEDYALYLFVITSADCPYIDEIPEELVYISVRPGDDNSVTVEDRSEWTRDIANYMYDLSSNTSFRVWPAILAALSATPVQDGTTTRRQIYSMRKEIVALRKQLASIEGVQ